MLLLFQIVVVVVVIVLFILYGSRELCPSCGTSLNDEPLNPLAGATKRSYCRCGWRASD